MRDKWRLLTQKFAVLSNRERLLILTAIFAVAYQIADLVVFERQFRDFQQLNAAMANDRTEIVRLTTDLKLQTARAQSDPNKSLRASVERTRKETHRLRDELDSATGALISPRDMAQVLEELLLQEKALTLLSLRTHDPTPLIERAAPEGEGGTKALLHQHGFLVEFSGGYLATLRYLEALEGLPWAFFWDNVDYEVVDYPDSVVRLQLHTLSLSEDWIGV